MLLGVFFVNFECAFMKFLCKFVDILLPSGRMPLMNSTFLFSFEAKAKRQLTSILSVFGFVGNLWINKNS